MKKIIKQIWTWFVRAMRAWHVWSRCDTVLASSDRITSGSDMSARIALTPSPYLYNIHVLLKLFISILTNSLVFHTVSWSTWYSHVNCRMVLQSTLYGVQKLRFIRYTHCLHPILPNLNLLRAIGIALLLHMHKCRWKSLYMPHACLQQIQ